MMNILFAPIILPAVAGLVALVVPKKWKSVQEIVTLIATLANLILACLLFRQEIYYSAPWGGGFGLEFSLRLYHFSSFIVLAAAGFSFLIALYSAVFMYKKELTNQFYAYLLLSVAMVNGAVLSDNMVAMLFFWEGLLLTLFGMIIVGHRGAYKTAIKALIIAGITDLCMMFGIGLTYYLAGTLTMSRISLPLNALGSIAFIFLMIGAISKAGSMPFHSWIPDAAIDAPLPFMAFLPASLEKLLGIYLLARISLDLFQLTPMSWVSIMLMIIGAITILLAVMMALIQKDYKKLLSYHAISQVGYMILGIGTAVPVGIVGGLFHMINHAMYKSCLFLSGGSIEKQTGTTDLNKLGGMASKMPITFICFLVAAAAISGVPPFNGFFSKELVYDGALERGWIFYLAAVLGSFFTAASFLKLGHAAYFGKVREEHKDVKEAPWPMLVPMIVIASFCVLFGVYNALPLNNLIQPILGEARLEGHNFAGLPSNVLLVVMTIIVLIAAFLNHRLGTHRTGRGIDAVDHIHHAPVLSGIYDRAERGTFDPYNIGLKIVNGFALVAYYTDRAFDWIYNTLTVKITYAFTAGIRKAHNGNYSMYILWSLAGIIVIALMVM